MQQENEFITNANFKITQEQLDKIRPYFKNVDEYLNNIGKFQTELNDAIVYELDEDYEDTDESIMLQKVYDEIYELNKR